MVEKRRSATNFSEAASELRKRDEEERRKTVEKSEGEIPSHVLQVVRCETSVTLHPFVLPFSKIDAEKFLNSLDKKFGLRFDRSIERNLFSTGQNYEYIEDTRLLSFGLENIRNMTVSFQDGRYNVSGNHHITISRVTFSSEQIVVQVLGTSQVAQVVASEVYEILCESAGEPKRWESEEVQNNIQQKMYGTHIKHRLPVSFNKFVERVVAGYFDESINKGTFSGKMFPRSKYTDFAEESHVAAIWSLDTLRIKVAGINFTTGRPLEGSLTFDISQRDEYGRAVVDIISEFQFDDHIHFVSGLLQTLSDDLSG